MSESVDKRGSRLIIGSVDSLFSSAMEEREDEATTSAAMSLREESV